MRKYDKHRGAITELRACSWLLAEGYEVFRNVSAFGPVDVVAIKDGVTRYIDVKSGIGDGSGTGTAADGVEVLYALADGSFKFRKARSKYITREMTPREKILARIGAQHLDGES